MANFRLVLIRWGANSHFAGDVRDHFNQHDVAVFMDAYNLENGLNLQVQCSKVSYDSASTSRAPNLLQRKPSAFKHCSSADITTHGGFSIIFLW